ncbi:hypothetical protein FG877_12520 [Enterococcus casseliflavus]|nr:hypothetical protein [Enterococcus casseliflavus]
MQSLRHQLHSQEPGRYFYKQGNWGSFCVCISNFNTLCLATFEVGTLLGIKLGESAKLWYSATKQGARVAPS